MAVAPTRVRSSSGRRGAGGPGEPLASWKIGVAQRLPNGNTLITESTARRAIELTPAGRIVWELMNPARAGKKR